MQKLIWKKGLSLLLVKRPKCAKKVNADSGDYDLHISKLHFEIRLKVERNPEVKPNRPYLPLT